MKSLLKKNWVKALAFIILSFMTLVFTASGFGLYSLIESGIFASNDEYDAQHKTIISGAYFWQQMALVESYYKTYAENKDNDNSNLDEYEFLFSEENSNFFFVVTDKNGKELLRNYKYDEYQYSQTSTRDILFNERFETKDLSFRSQKDRQDYIQMCERNYADVGHQAWEGDIDDDGRLDYVLRIWYKNWDKQTITITGYVRSQLTVTDGFSDAAIWMSNLFSFRYVMIVCCALSFIFGIILFIFLMLGAGRNERGDGTRLNWPDKIPFDLYAPLPLFAAYFFIKLFFNNAYGSYDLNDYIIYGCVPAGLWISLILSLPITFAARVRNGGWWKNTVIYLIYRGSAYLFSFLTLFWREGLVCLGIALIELSAFTIFKGNESVLFWLWLTEKLLLSIIVILAIIDMKRLRKGGKEIASGNLTYTMDSKNMLPSFKKHANDLNNINAGMNLTLEKQIKYERMKTELITNVSHDIKTPLTSIVSYVDLLKKEGLTTSEAKEYVSVLERQSERLKKLAEDLVEAAKASTGNLHVDFEQLDINLLLSQALGEYEERLKKQKLEVVLTLVSQGAEILADGRLLWRVLDNLFSNLCKYALKGTRVYISTETNENYVSVTLKNISNHKLNISGDELIERFVQGDSSRASEGSGLGLSIAKSLTELQKGRFDMDIDGDLFKTVLTFERYKNKNIGI